jgi:hypothetical protein
MALCGFRLGPSYLLFEVNYLCKCQGSQVGVAQCVH